MEQENLRYPVGRAEEVPYDEKVKQSYLVDIQMCPSLLEDAVSNLDDHQLNTAYRDGGWTIKQVVHHVADSHMNAYIRFKLALTEDNPTIKPYNEAAWAELSDTKNLPINISLTLLFALHARWTELLKNNTMEDWQKTVFHPERKQNVSLWNLLSTYAWHGRHHTAHITKLRERMGWN